MPKRPSKPKKEAGQRIKAVEVSDKGGLHQQPIFSLRYLQPGYCVDDCSGIEKAAFADALWRRSQLTWLQLMQSPRVGLGSETIARTAINVSIPSAITHDVTFLSFRCQTAGRMIGFRDLAVFHVIWIDPKLEVYDH